MYTQVTYILYNIHIKTHRKTRQAKLQNSDEKHIGNMMADEICYDLLVSINWGCCFFPLRKWIFPLHVAATFGLQSWAFSAASFFPASAWFFFASDSFFPPRTVFPLPPEWFFLLQRCFFCCFEFFRLRRHLLLAFFPAAKTAFFRCKAFFSCFQTCFFPFRCFFPAANLFFRAARRQGAEDADIYGRSPLASWIAHGTNRWQSDFFFFCCGRFRSEARS